MPIRSAYTVHFPGYRENAAGSGGNHDEWLTDYILEYFATPERKRKKLNAYGYNSFELLRQRITEVDGKKYLSAHAMTSDPEVREEDRYYLMGTMDIDSFFCAGIDRYISMCGHTPTDSIVWKKDRRYLDEPCTSIWVNDRRNVYLLDCGLMPRTAWNCGDFIGGLLIIGNLPYKSSPIPVEYHRYAW